MANKTKHALKALSVCVQPVVAKVKTPILTSEYVSFVDLEIKRRFKVKNKEKVKIY